MDCGNECPKCGIVIWTWKVEDYKDVNKVMEEMNESREYLSSLEKENAEMRFILKELITYLRFDSSYHGLGWSKRINKVLGRK